MKIAQVGPYPLSPDCIRGGVESSVFGLTNELVKSHDVEVFDTPRIGGRDHTNGYVHRYANCGKHNEDAVYRAEDVVRDIVAVHPEAIHIHGTGVFSYTIYCQLRKRGLHPLVTIHGLLKVEKKNQLLRHPSAKHLYQFIRQSWVECRFLRKMECAVVDTAYLLDALRHYPVRRLPQLHVVPQGIDDAYFNIPLLNRNSTEEQSILCVGTYSQRKGQLLLIKAFELLMGRLQVEQYAMPVRLVLAGIVAERDYYDDVQSYVNTSPYKNQIDVLVDLSNEQLIAQYSQATLFALHTQEESQGIVLVEAMAMRLPVVSTRVGGVPYVVTDGQTGFLVSYGDVASMSERLYQLLIDKDLQQRIMLCAKKHASAYHWTLIANQIIALYTNLSDIPS